LANPVELQKKWALVGAEARLKEIQTEVDEIYQVFPELRGRKGPSRPALPTKTSGKRQFSDTGKAAISEGMRKYWARRKAAAAKAAKAAAKAKD
jgi:hypothetical protein